MKSGLKATAHIIGIGSYVPDRILSNSDLEKLVDTTDEWITTRTGIKERRIAALDEFASTMGTQAAQQALQNAHVPIEQIDLILVATMSPDYLFPSTAALIQSHLKAPQAVALDLQAACSGFIYALSIAKAYIESGLYNHILLIAAEKMSALVDYQDRKTCVLFGDGAAAVVIANHGPGLEIGTPCLGTDGCLAELLFAPAGGTRLPASQETVSEKSHFLKMNGQELFKHAVRRLSAAAIEALNTSQLKSDNIDWFIPHQANDRIIDATAKALQFPQNKVYKNLQKYGNTSAASIGIALHELLQEHPPSLKMRILLAAFGAGLTWGAVVLTKV